MTTASSNTDFTIADDLSSLRLTRNGAPAIATAESLRAACKCAHCTRARYDGRFSTSFPGIAIVAADDLGYGLNLAFSDGHDRGIYPWPYLATLVEQ